MDSNFQKELNEAIYAGETALKSLKDARKYLDSAGNWGLLDIFGGNGFTGVFKHLKLSNANNCMQNAKNDLRRFARELDDIDEKIPNIEIGGFLTFADFFFDGLIAGIYIQSKIGDMKNQVNEAIRNTEELLVRLKNYR